MPSRYRVKSYASESYYHIYARGVEKRRLFLDQQDYLFFLHLVKRYLGRVGISDRQGRPYVDLSPEIELLAFCLMPNHIHLLVYQHAPAAITRLLRRLLGSYSQYFNRKYQRVGNLFHDRYKAVIIDNEAYLWHISRYIHLNPMGIYQDNLDYPYSSLGHYTGIRSATWIKPRRVLDMHAGYRQSYLEFVQDYTDYKRVLNEIEHFLAQPE